MKHEFDINNIEHLSLQETKKLLFAIVRHLDLNVEFNVDEENKTYDFEVKYNKRSKYKELLKCLGIKKI